MRCQLGQQTTRGRELRAILNAGWRPTLRATVEPTIARLLDRAERLKVRPGWIRGHSEGCRLQVFDESGTRVAHISLDEIGQRLLVREQRLRLHLGALAPRIVQSLPGGEAYAEEWIQGHFMRPSLKVLAEVLEALGRQLYRPRPISFDLYQRGLGRARTLEEIDSQGLAMAQRLLGDTELPLSWVHGDLWSGNCIRTGKGDWVLLDWEYARRCAVTYDGWLYAYVWRRQGNYHPEKFAEDLEELFATVYGIKDRSHIRGWHLLHLVERRVFLHSLGKRAPHEVLKMMKDDIAWALNSIA